MAFFDGRIIGSPTISRRLVQTNAGPVEVQDVTVEIENVDGTIVDDLRGLPFSLDIYNTVTGVGTVQWTGVVSEMVRNRGKVTLVGTNFDGSVFEQLIPGKVVDKTLFPLAQDLGRAIPWIFGNAKDVPLPYVREDNITSQYDYLLGLSVISVIDATRIGSGNTRFPISYAELEPQHGSTLFNPGFDDWVNTTTPYQWTFGVSGGGPFPTAQQVPPAVGQPLQAPYCVFFTNSNGFDGYLYQQLENADANYPLSWYQGRPFTFSMWVFTGTASRFQLFVQDGVNNFLSPLHPGGATWVQLTVSGTIASAATFVKVAIYITSGTAVSGYFDAGAMKLGSRNWGEALRRDLYPGYAALRFLTRQTNSSGNLYSIVASIAGIAARRNPLQAVARLLDDTTLGLSKTVDPNWGVLEEPAIFDYESAVLRYNPLLFYQFNDRPDITENPHSCIDSSGYGLHGVYNGTMRTVLDIDFGDSGIDSGRECHYVPVLNADFVSFSDTPPSTQFSTTSFAVSVIYVPTQAISATARCIVDCIVGTATGTRLTLFTQNSRVQVTLKTSVGTATLQSAVMDDLLDSFIAHHLIVSVDDVAKTFTLYGVGGSFGAAPSLSTPVILATSAYVGTPGTGVGSIRIGRFGAGNNNTSDGAFDNFCYFPTALTDAAAAELQTYYLLGRDGSRIPSWKSLHQNTMPVSSPYFPFPAATAWYRLGDFDFGGTTLNDDALTGSPHNGAYINTGTLGGVATAYGGLSVYSGADGSDAAFALNNLGLIPSGSFIPSPTACAYAKVTTPPFNSATAFTVNCWYYPVRTDQVHSGLVEKTVGGAVNTQYLMFQETLSIAFRCVNTSLNLFTCSYAMSPDDVFRYMMLTGVFDGSTVSLYRNGVLVQSLPFSGTLNTGAGDFLIGRLGTSGGAPNGIYPGQGAIDEVAIWNGTALTADQIMTLYKAATWYPGGLLVDFAMVEQRQAQDWFREIFLTRGIRLNVNAAGQFTPIIDRAGVAPTLNLRDGAGDGIEPNLLNLEGRRRPTLRDAVKDYIYRYRRDMITGQFQREIRIPVSTLLDASGNRIGQDFVEESWVVRSEPAADRVADYNAKYLKADETVQATVTPSESVTLFEGMKVTLTDPSMGYDNDIMYIRGLDKELTQTQLTLAQDPATTTGDPFNYEPSTFPVGPLQREPVV